MQNKAVKASDSVEVVGLSHRLLKARKRHRCLHDHVLNFSLLCKVMASARNAAARPGQFAFSVSVPDDPCALPAPGFAAAVWDNNPPWSMAGLAATPGEFFAEMFAGAKSMRQGRTGIGWPIVTLLCIFSMGRFEK